MGGHGKPLLPPLPLLATRPARGLLQQLRAPQALAAREGLCLVDEGRLYVKGEELLSNFVEKGLSIAPGEKQLVNMGAWLLLFPDKLYINCQNPSDCGSMEASVSYEGPVTLSLCRADGEYLQGAVLSPTEPESPANGMLWMDSSQSPHSLKQYSSSAALWVALASTYVRLEAPGVGAAFGKNDGVSLAGLGGSEELAALNGQKLLSAVGEDFVVFPGILDEVFAGEQQVEICRRVPDMDFVIEAENRLWGCRCGLQEGKQVNEIYGSALGDFKNWNRFQGLASDSYALSLGDHGPFTGAVSHLGTPLFFKEGSLHKLYLSAAGAHRLVSTPCRGVQAGSHKSLCLVGEKLFYKSPDGVCLYDGSLPRNVGAALGEEKYHDARAGALGSRYYLSMADSAGDFHLFVYDSSRALWHREDGTKALAFAAQDSELYFIDEDSGKLWAVQGSAGEPEGTLPFRADSGLMGYREREQKYVSRLLLRLQLPPGSELELFIQYDSQGPWHSAGRILGRGTGSFLLPLRPRRCDHFRLRLQGRGEMKLFSLSRVLEKGGEV